MKLGSRRVGALVTTAIAIVGLAGTVAVSPRVAAAGSHPSAAAGTRNVAGVAIVVNETADEVAVSPVQGLPLLCVTASLKCSLRAAIQVANFDSANSLGPDTITFDPTVTGPYKLTIPPTGPAGASNDDITSGDLNVSGTMTITGNGAGATIIDGNNLDRVFRVELGGSLTASKLTVQHGKIIGASTSAPNVRAICGAGILSQGTLVVSDATIAANTCESRGMTAAGDGGGVDTAQRNAGDTPPATTLTRVTITGNSAPFGGGVSQDIAARGSGRTTLIDSVVTDNVAPNVANQLFIFTGGGGGVHENGGTVALLRTRVAANRAGTIGGGVYEDGGGTVTVTDSVVADNTAGEYAGGVLEDGGGVLTLLRTTVESNTAASYAGGMYLDGGGVDTIDSSRVINNHALGGAGVQISIFAPPLIERGSGGGIVEDGGGPTKIVHSTISGNTGSHGAGLYIDGGSSDFSITASTISGNVATPLGNGGAEDGDGGGILSDFGDAVTIKNSTISGNAGGSHGGGIVTRSDFTARLAAVQGARSASRTSHRRALNNKVNAVVVSNSTIVGNTRTGTNGSAIDNGLTASLLTLHDDILAGSGKVCTGGGTSTGGNIVGDATCPAAAGDKSNADALLQPLADNPPGLTQTRLVAAGSPAIGAGTSCPATDQRDQSRPADGCTSGAVEYQRAAATPTPTPTPTPTGTPTPAAGLRGVPVTGGGPGGADAAQAGPGQLPAALIVSLGGGIGLAWAGRRSRSHRVR